DAENHGSVLPVEAGLKPAEQAFRLMRTELKRRTSNGEFAKFILISPFLTTPAGTEVSANIEPRPCVDRRRRRGRPDQHVGRPCRAPRVENNQRNACEVELFHHTPPENAIHMIPAGARFGCDDLTTLKVCFKSYQSISRYRLTRITRRQSRIRFWRSSLVLGRLLPE